MTTPDYLQRDQDAAEDRAAASAKWLRGYVQLRGVLVQNPEPVSDRSGPLADFVRERQHRALLLYMMLLSVWPWLHDDRNPLEAAAWMNLLHSRSANGRALVWSESTLSRTWKYLERKGLIEKKRGRKGRLLVQPRLEDGTAPYTFPSGEKKKWSEAYFVLPERFWLEEDFAKLSLPGLAMLLVIAKETNKASEIRITQEQIAEWYGFHRSTVFKGLASLRSLGLLVERTEWIPARLSKIRTTQATHYSLASEYSTEERAKARANAERRRRRSARTAPITGGPVFVDEAGG